MSAFCKWLLATVCACGLLGTAHGQGAYPAQPIRFIVPAPAGGVADLFARSIADVMAARMGQAIVVENRSGGNTAIGVNAIVAAPNDGYAWLLVVPNFFSTPLLQKTPAWNAVQDFALVGKFGTSPNVLVVRVDLPVKSVRELVEAARAQPGKLNGGVIQGSSLHFNLEALAQQTGIEVLAVPYVGAPPIVQGLGTRTLDLAFLPLSVAAPQLASGRMRALAIAANTRSPQLPDVPTLAEAGFPAANLVPWYGLAVTRGVPADILRRINAEVNASIASPEVQARLLKLGSQASPAATLEELEALNRSDYALYGKLIRNGKFSLE